MSANFVVVGLSRARRAWTAEVARWATAGVAPVEFLKCLSREEVSVLLGAGRQISAVLIDTSSTPIERELVAELNAAGCATVAVSNGRTHHDWESLGCVAALDDDFDHAELMEVLSRHAHTVDRSIRKAGMVHLELSPDTDSRLVTVIGAGGVGTSTVAIALAQGLAQTGDESVVLVDGARRGDLAMFHDVGDVIPGLPELVEAHRRDRLAPDDVRSLCFDIATRGYSLLLGIRRPREWVALPQPSLDASLDALGSAFSTVILDVDHDLEDEHSTGSLDVADRHAMTLLSLDRADLVVVVGTTDMKGLHSLQRLHTDLVDMGVSAERICVVLNMAGRRPSTRALLTRSLARLGAGAGEPPIFVRRVRHMDDIHHLAGPLPTSVLRPLSRAVRDRLERVPVKASPMLSEPEPIVPSSVGSFGTHTGEVA